MSIKTIIERLSFKKLTGLALISAIVLMIPISVELSKQQTKTTGKAYFEKSDITSSKPLEYGNSPIGKPNISLVWPFLGKPGDVVLIYGNNFGNNPKNKTLYLGLQFIPENNIIAWTPEVIEFQIPKDFQTNTFDFIKLTIKEQTTEWKHPFTVYSTNTIVQVKKQEEFLSVANYPITDGVVNIDFDDGSQITAKVNDNISLPTDKSIISIYLTDDDGRNIPFYVDPGDFGF